MKTLLLLLNLVLIACNSLAQQPSLVWAKQIGGSDAQHSHAVIQDFSGNLLNAGYFYGVTDFNPGAASTLLSSNGAKDAYVCKLDNNGNLLWAFNFGGSGEEQIFDVATDVFGNVVVVGRFNSSSFDADPGPNVVTLSTTSFYSASFIIKLDANGVYQWSTVYTSPMSSSSLAAKSIEIDNNGNITVAGEMNIVQFDAVDFNLTAGTNTLDHNFHFFIVKLTASGVFVDLIGFEGSYNMSPFLMDILVDEESNIYICGHFYSTMDFDTGPLDFEINAGGYYAAFVCKVNSIGQLQWVTSVKDDNSSMYSTSIYLDNNQHVYMTGTFNDAVDFNSDLSSTSILTNYSGYENGYLLKLNEQGSFVFAKNMAYGPGSICNDLVVDNDNNIYVIGSFSGTADLNPDETGVSNKNAISSSDIFITKLNVNNEFQYSNVFGSSGIDLGRTIMMDEDSSRYIVSGTFNNTIDVDPNDNIVNMTSGGNGDVFVIKYTECSAVATSFEAVGCGSYEWNGQGYTVSGTYNQSFIAASGCDSLATLYLTIASANSSNVVVEACDQYLFNDVVYETSGDYTATLTNALGCDSIVFLDLTIIETPAVQLSVSENTITAVGTATSYQWFNCADNQLIEGATSSTYSPTQSGEYGVYAYLGPCTEQVCVGFTFIGVEEIKGDQFSIYPNPAVQSVSINSTIAWNNARLCIINATGSLVMNKTINGKVQQIDVSELASGVYYVQIFDNGHLSQKKFIKE